MSGPGKMDIDGEVDARWQSYYDPEKHGTKTMSETIAGTTEDDKHSEKTITWPEEVEPDSLTDKQRKAFELALQNPKRSCESIDDELNSIKYSSEVFRTKAPEWYENVFKPQTEGKSPGKSGVKLDREAVKEALAELGQASASELKSELGYSHSAVRSGLDALNVDVETGVDGYHGNAKVYSLQETQDDSEASDADVKQSVESEPVETPMPSIKEVEEVKTVCNYAKRKDSPEGELAEYILEVLG